ncbi:MAG: universal stress protein [Gemmatimonadaceae bacterium]
MRIVDRSLPISSTADGANCGAVCASTGEPCDGDGRCGTTQTAGAATIDAGLPSLRGRRVLLATDGSPASDAATKVAWELATRHGALVEMLHVVDDRPSLIPPPLDVMLAFTDEVSRERTYDDQVRALKWRASHIVDAQVDWEPRILFGTPARTIAFEAHAADAALIVMGLRRYSRADRITNDETTLSTIRVAGRPVLAVVGEADTLPTRVLSAMDFSTASVAAAHFAAQVMRAHGKITMAYVPPLAGYHPDDNTQIIHELGIAAAFERYASVLRAHDCTVDHVVLHHELRRPIASAIADHAELMHADMIAVGNVGHGRMERWLLGSVSQDLVRDAKCSLLIVPAAPGHDDDASP